LQRFGVGKRAPEKVFVIIAQGGVLRLWCNDSFEYSERDLRRNDFIYENPRK
jgi:hypothetical protein